MRRWKWLLVVVGVLLPFAVRAEFDPKLFFKLIPSVVKVEAYNADGSVNIGSGVMVKEGIVATNCHVTRKARSIQVGQTGARWTVRAQSRDMDHDLCLLHVPHATAPVVTFKPDKPKVGQVVIALGYVGGVAPQMSTGEIKALYDYDGGTVIQSTTPFTSGASGGGLFDEEGRLVGLVTFKYRGEQAYHFSLPVEWIFRNLDHALEKVEPWVGGRAFWERPLEDQPYFLRAAALEAGSQWAALREVAEAWSWSEADNANAWLALGKALHHLKQDSQAVQAYRRALALDLESAETWYYLGLAQVALAERAEADYALKVLAGLNPRLAEKLQQSMMLY
ncbi:S1 family peptidase [Pelomicrobium sp.]|jgi:serine protease Do|uniref:S1 family peptidase n=1 Tax=Pelomicrobium sp. TaxID=2815319 RepID=UPI002FDC8AFC